jgi:hypothetical protein
MSIFFLLIISIAILTVLGRLVYFKLYINLRGIFLISIIIISLLGLLMISLYTFDNMIHFNQIDMPGDAMHYFNRALEYICSNNLDTGKAKSYVFFISKFLIKTNAFFIRIAQLFLFILIYIASSYLLGKFRISKKGFILFSSLLVPNGIYYGIITPTERDIFLLLFYVLALILLALIMKNYLDKNLFSFSSLRMFIILSVVLFVMNDLQFFSVFSVLIAFICCCIYFLIISNRSLLNKILFLILSSSIVLVSVLFFLNLDYLIYSIMADLIGETGRREVISLSGTGAVESNLLLATFRFVLGPGLIRPLFPELFFNTYTNMSAFFYFWGTVVWYTNIILTLPLIIKNPFKIFNNPASIMILIFLFIFVVVYSLHFGGASGMRKRAVVHFFYTVLIVNTYYTKYNYESMKVKIHFNNLKKILKCIPHLLVSALTSLLLIFVNLRGLSY